MSVKNAYPELPEIPYKKTNVEMGLVVAFIQRTYFHVNVKRAAYVYFRNESGNGRSGVNNNYAGIQADGGRWLNDQDFAGTCVTPENKTGKKRRFVTFNAWEDSVMFTLNTAQRRGMYISGETTIVSKLKVRTITDLVQAYKREWVTGNPKYVPASDEVAAFASMYRQAEKLFQ